MAERNAIEVAQDNIQRGRADLAIEALLAYSLIQPQDFYAWRLLGIAYHEEQQEVEAGNAFRKALEIRPDDVCVVLAYAQSRYYSGYSAVEPFQRYMQLAPEDLNGLRGYVMALAADGEPDQAEELLTRALRDHPDWLAGHKLLATQRYTTGDQKAFADSYRDACEASPENLQLRLEWFRAVAQVQDWESAIQILADGEERLGSCIQFSLGRLFVACESGDDTNAARLFYETRESDDVIRDMALVRFSLRQGDMTTAESVARRRLQTASANVFWPYLSLIWRLRGDPALTWLEGEKPWIKSLDLHFTITELNDLASVLLKLHTARSPFAEQSVRGGTQTDQNLFLRHEPILGLLKERISGGIKKYVSGLPRAVPGHPLLGIPREQPLAGRVQFSGSWSVRLRSQGFNVSHTHPMGWISSAFYVKLPKADKLGRPPAGWIQFGTPPPELELPLQASMKIKPKVGHLVLFPSTTWHSTVPFDDGERLVVAFDVRPPRGAQ